VQELLELGAVHAINTTDEDWQDDLKTQCNKYQPRLAFDAVGGELTGKILHVMPNGSVIKVYGGLANELCTVSPGDFIFGNKKLEGFWLNEYVKTKGLVGLALWNRKQKSLLGSDLKTTVKEVVDIENIGAALRSYLDNMAAGKVLLTARKGDKAGKGKEKKEEVAEEEEQGTSTQEQDIKDRTKFPSSEEIVLGSEVETKQEGDSGDSGDVGASST